MIYWKVRLQLLFKFSFYIQRLSLRTPNNFYSKNEHQPLPLEIAAGTFIVFGAIKLPLHILGVCVCVHRKRGDNNLFYLNNCIWIPDSISGNYCTLETLHPTCFWWSSAKFSSGIYWAAIVLCARGSKTYYERLNCTVSIYSNLNHGNNSSCHQELLKVFA